MFRVLLTFLIMGLILFGNHEASHIWLVIIGLFIIAALTDLADGEIARRCNAVTTFGKFIDPIADKFLIIGIMICLLAKMPTFPVNTGLSSLSDINFGLSHADIMAICIVITLARELMISSIRMLSAEQGIVISANVWGKVKTVIQILSIVIYLFAIWARWDGFGVLAIMISTLVVLISGITYVLDFVKLTKSKK